MKLIARDRSRRLLSVLSVLSVPTALAVLAVGCVGASDPTELVPDPPADPLADPPAAAGTEIVFTAYPADVLARDGGSTDVGFVAIQDGDGPWQVVTGQNGVYKARVQNKRYGVAVACKGHRQGSSSSTYSGVDVMLTTTDESTALNSYSCYTPAAPKVVTGSVTGETGTDLAEVQVSSFERLQPAETRTFSFHAPTRRLSVFGITRPVGSSSSSPSRVVRAPDVDTAVTSSVNVDFSQSMELATQPLTLATRPGTVTVSSGVYSNNDFYVQARGTATSYRVVPASMLNAGDLIRVSATHTTDDLGWEISNLFLAQPAPASIGFGQPLTAAAPSFPAGAQRLPVFSFTAGGATLANVSYDAVASTSTETQERSLHVSLSRGWLGGDRAVSYSFPDLSGIAGWQDSMALHPGEVSWTVARGERSARVVVAGSTSYSVGRTGVVTN